ncbi:hypothetical protein [Archangium gephyra]|uniref:Uncharacterized protein n=1 Tax=Archangium gephyra TaxID=48 RepID=A0AAC8Q7A0_9BACT|nr:hypothetical protein [Archangium gephyra]AKJ02315.1 Hypothetical protein AA314_03941 [Archangium gephyra]
MHPLPEALPIAPSSIRVIGLVKFAAAFAVAGALWWLSGPMDVLSEVLVIFGMSGLLELLTGVSTGAMARRWDTLKPWQRAVASLLVILAVIGFFLAVGAVILRLNG